MCAFKHILEMFSSESEVCDILEKSESKLAELPAECYSKLLIDSGRVL